MKKGEISYEKACAVLLELGFQDETEQANRLIEEQGLQGGPLLKAYVRSGNPHIYECDTKQDVIDLCREFSA